MTDREKLPSGDVERVAGQCPCCRAPCGVEITPAHTVQYKNEYGDYQTQYRLGIKQYRFNAALSAMPDRQAAINEGLEMAAKACEAWSASNYSEECSTMADAIAHEVRAMKVEK